MAARVLDGQVKLFAAMPHEEKAVIAQHRIPDETTRPRRSKSCWSMWTWQVPRSPPTPSNAQRDIAQYIAGKEVDGGRAAAYFLFVRGNQPKLRQLTRGIGKDRAQVTVSNTQLKVHHKLLSIPGTRYQDLGPSTTTSAPRPGTTSPSSTPSAATSSSPPRAGPDDGAGGPQTAAA